MQQFHKISVTDGQAVITEWKPKLKQSQSRAKQILCRKAERRNSGNSGNISGNITDETYASACALEFLIALMNASHSVAEKLVFLTKFWSGVHAVGKANSKAFNKLCCKKI
jgi:hypothetical protein